MNIPGVEILYTSKYVYETTWGWTWFALIFIILAIVSIVLLCYNIYFREYKSVPMLCIAGIGSIILSLIFLSSGKTIYGTEYYVRINNDVAFTQVASQYNIYDVKGQIYILRPNIYTE